MSKKDNFDNKENQVIENQVSSFLSNNSKIIKYILIAIVVVILGIIILNAAMNSKAEKNMDALEVAQTEFASATAADADSETYSEDLEKAISDLEALENEKGYVGLKSSYLLALKEFSDEDYQSALDKFINISEKASGTYMGSLSLSNAIVCAEQLGDDLLVEEYCQQLLDTYGNDAAETPKTMFTLARIYEKQGNSELAQGQFQQLADQFPNSEYGKLAQNSLLNY
ncbi:MAG: hypothetical protein PQJ49_02255 [Sphaerochaetaceae bacterium]|nr:hypothetical protein [Sphaerochaetaceae bacterium]MDC7248726.1 hypothetical protein [Sphaerochaetaceae bacterium]